MGSRGIVKHVPVVLTALLVPQVVHILQLLVLLEPMPVVLRAFVIHVVLENTMIKQVKMFVNVALQESIKTNRGKHHATTIVLVPW